MRQRRVVVRARAGRLEQRVGAVPLGRLDVLPHDAVPHDRRDAGPRLGQLTLEEVRSAEPLHRRRVGGGQLQRCAQPLEPVHLVGPDVRRERQPVLGARRVQRVGIAAAPLHDPHLIVRRVLPLPRAVQPHGARGVAEHDPLGDLVRVPLDEQVEPAARAQLEQPDRQPGAALHLQQPAEQRAAAPHLVGLHRPPDQLAQVVQVLGNGVEHRRPDVAGRAAHARVVQRERGCPALEDQAVQRSREPQRRDAARRVVRERGEQVPHDAARLVVGGGGLQQRGRQRAARLAAVPGLQPDPLDQAHGAVRSTSAR